MQRKTAYIVQALVGNRYIGGFQVWEETRVVASNGVTVLASCERRIPADRGVTMEEARALLAEV